MTLSPELLEQFEALLTPLYPADKPGAAVIVVKDGETIFRKGYGMANLELGVPIEPQMVFRLGSFDAQGHITECIFCQGPQTMPLKKLS